MARDPLDVTRTRAAVLSIVTIAAVVAPLVRAPTDDSFPLSTYPMFAIRRPRTLTLDYAYGVTASGERRALSPMHVGTGEVLQAAALFDDAVRGGPKALAPLCEQIATRVAADSALGDVVTLRIVSATHDAIAYLVDGTLGREFERWTCAAR